MNNYIEYKFLKGLTEEEKKTVIEYAELLYLQDADPRQLQGSNIEAVKSKIYADGSRNLFSYAKDLANYLWNKRQHKRWEA
ncbi:MAG: hypothetical protein SCJ93_12070 [Bacillota bacterium]|nr:hypothetical protein [Bacillota bacterium]